MRRLRIPGVLVVMALVAMLRVTERSVSSQATGKFQLHFIDVGEGDAALVVSPSGETVMIDNGVFGQCDRTLSYLQQLGVNRVDYQIASHFHADHIGCTAELLADLPLTHAAFDRGGTYHGEIFSSYVTALGGKRKTLAADTVITLDEGSAHPVTIRVLAAGGNGVTTQNEDALSAVTTVSFDQFRAVLGGDLTGFADNDYADVESSVATKVGPVDVYKVHGHGSRYATNSAWLQAVQPRVGIISTGVENREVHPSAESLERLHRAGVKTYWTEAGHGARPEPGMDVVAGNVVVEMAASAKTFTVAYAAGRRLAVDEYAIRSTGPGGPTPTVSYAWSKLSNVYHYSSCRFVKNIDPDSLETGTTSPAGRSLHAGCPK